MTTSTPNLGLVLYNSTTDSSEYFSNFRSTIAGTSLSSNFYKIDTAYGSMQTEIDEIQNGAYLASASLISPNYYEATVTGILSYVVGSKIILKLGTSSSGTVTLNINSLGTKSVMKVDSGGSPVNFASGELSANRYYFFVYDGTRWVWVNGTSSDQIYAISGTSGNVVTVGSDNMLLGTLTQSLLISQTINSATNKATPVSADRFGFWDSISSALRYCTWDNIVTTLSSIFTDLSSSQTITGVKQFGTIGGSVGKLSLAGSTSGSTILNASAIAGSTTVVLPAINDTLVGLTNTATLTNKRITPRVSTETSSATPTINTDNVDAHSITALATAITSMTTNLSGTPSNFEKLIIRIKDNGTARAITWGSGFEAKGAKLPTTTIISKVLTVGFIYDTVTSKWGCVASAQEE